MAKYRHLGIPHLQWEKYRHPITPQAGLDIPEFTVPARDGYPIRVRVYHQSNGPNGLPLLIYFHGGGFITGGLESDDNALRRVAAELPVVVLSVEYRLAPEYPFPVGFEDGLDIVKWAASKQSRSHLTAHNLKTSPSSGLILGGTSAGISHILAQDPKKDELYRAVTGILFLAGTICHEDARPAHHLDNFLSIDEITNSAGLTKEVIAYFASKYAAPPSDPRRAQWSMYGWDPRRDETQLFEETLRGEGVETRKYVYPGFPHGFWTTCPDLQCAKDWEEDFVEGIRFLLGT
ncbi:Alpha/Beta hydrolase protein [Aspergillus oleicola]